MDRNITRGLIAVVAGAALAAAGSGGTAGPSASASAARVATARSAGTPDGTSPGARLWIARYNGRRNTDNDAGSVAVSRDGRTLFVTGTSMKALAGDGPGDYVTIAYRTATGTRRWISRYNGPGNSFDQAASLALSPGGGTVFVTGSSSTRQGGPSDWATVAYRAATGARLWVSRYNGRKAGSDSHASSLAVSPDGKTVFVTGYSISPGGTADYVTIAYRAATGARLWIARYSGSFPGSQDWAGSLAVGPGGGRVFVTGSSGNDFATVAYRAATGARLWVSRYPGPSNPREDGGAASVAVSHSGRTVFVTGTSSGPGSGTGYATIAYRAATGAQLWAAVYDAPSGGSSRAGALAVSRDGSKVFVTGAGAGDYATVGYNAVTGDQLWAARYNGPGNAADWASSLAVSPTGSRVYVTGTSFGVKAYDCATIAYRAATGTTLWVMRYNGPGDRGAAGLAVAVSPAGSRVFVTGTSAGTTTHSAYTTVAYRG